MAAWTSSRLPERSVVGPQAGRTGVWGSGQVGGRGSLEDNQRSATRSLRNCVSSGSGDPRADESGDQLESHPRGHKALTEQSRADLGAPGPVGEGGSSWKRHIHEDSQLAGRSARSRQAESE